MSIADANKVQELIKEITKQIGRELDALKQTVTKLEQRVASLETKKASLLHVLQS
jgi:polyhydroxyalkanoate synthesis regulator phasin